MKEKVEEKKVNDKRRIGELVKKEEKREVIGVQIKEESKTQKITNFDAKIAAEPVNLPTLDLGIDFDVLAERDAEIERKRKGKGKEKRKRKIQRQRQRKRETKRKPKGKGKETREFLLAPLLARQMGAYLQYGNLCMLRKKEDAYLGALGYTIQHLD